MSCAVSMRHRLIVFGVRQVSTVVEAMAAHPGTAAVQTSGLLRLRLLIFSGDDDAAGAAAAVALATGAAAVAVAAMQQLPAVAAVQEHGCAALHCLASFGGGAQLPRRSAQFTQLTKPWRRSQYLTGSLPPPRRGGPGCGGRGRRGGGCGGGADGLRRGRGDCLECL